MKLIIKKIRNKLIYFISRISKTIKVKLHHGFDVGLVPFGAGIKNFNVIEQDAANFIYDALSVAFNNNTGGGI